jgi:hypothetical protein
MTLEQELKTMTIRQLVIKGDALVAEIDSLPTPRTGHARKYRHSLVTALKAIQEEYRNR